jgi:hypothetical protein
MKFNVQINITDATEAEIIAYFNRGSTAASVATMVHAASTGASAMPSGATADDDNGAPNLNAPAIDSAHLPHDPRIHSDNKGLNKDGTWRKRRGVDAALVAAVEAEMRSRIQPGQPGNPPMPHNPNTTVMPPAQQQPPYIPPMPDPSLQYQPNPAMQQYTPPPGNPNYPPQQYQPQASAPVAMDFTGFMQHLTGQFNKRDQSGQPLITTEYLAGVAQRLSAQLGTPINAITDLGANPNAIAFAVQMITADGRWN